MISPIWSLDFPSSFTVWALLFTTSAMRFMPSTVSPTTFPPCSALTRACFAVSAATLAFFEFSMMVLVISSTALATSPAWLVCSCAPAAICSVLELIWLDALAVALTASLTFRRASWREPPTLLMLSLMSCRSPR